MDKKKRIMEEIGSVIANAKELKKEIDDNDMSFPPEKKGEAKMMVDKETVGILSSKFWHYMEDE